MRNQWTVLHYFKFCHRRSGASDEGRLCGRLLFLLQFTRCVVLCWQLWAGGCGSFWDEESHPTGLGSPTDPRYLLNTAVPPQQVGELVQSAHRTGLEGTLTKGKRRGEEIQELLIGDRMGPFKRSRFLQKTHCPDRVTLHTGQRNTSNTHAHLPAASGVCVCAPSHLCYQRSGATLQFDKGVWVERIRHGRMCHQQWRPLKGDTLGRVWNWNPLEHSWLLRASLWELQFIPTVLRGRLKGEMEVETHFPASDKY